jgi:hypothetical protein
MMLALLAYLWIAWFVLPTQAVWGPDEGARLLQLQSLRIEDFHLAHDIAYSGRKLDPNLEFAQQFAKPNLLLRIREDGLYFQRLPIFPMIVLPLFRLFGYSGLYLLPAISGAVSSVLALDLLERNERRFAMWALTAFGSPLLIYATLFSEHTLATSLGLVGAWLASRMGPVRRKGSLGMVVGWISVGVVLGISVYIRLEMVLFALSLLFVYWFIVQDGRWGPIWAGASLGVTLLPYIPLHWAMFGHLLPGNANFLASFDPLGYLARVEWRAVVDLLLGPSRDAAIDPGWLGGLWAIASVIAVVHSLASTDSPSVRKLQWVGLGIVVVVGAVFLFNSTFYRSAHGIFSTTPWAILGLCQAHEVWRRGSRRAKIIVLSTVFGLIGYTVGVIFLRAPHSGARGGLEWGNRYIMTFYPFLALMAAWDIGSKRYNARTLTVIGALLFLGVGFQIRGIWTVRHDKQISLYLNQLIAETPEQHVVSDLWWLPIDTAPIHGKKALFVAPTPERLGHWVELAAASQVQQFCLVTLDGTLLEDVTQHLDRYTLRVVESRRLENLLVFHVAIEPNLSAISQRPCSHKLRP